MTMRADQCFTRSIAQGLCRSASTISRELKRTSGCGVHNGWCQVPTALPDNESNRHSPRYRASCTVFNLGSVARLRPYLISVCATLEAAAH